MVNLQEYSKNYSSDALCNYVYKGIIMLILRELNNTEHHR